MSDSMTVGSVYAVPVRDDHRDPNEKSTSPPLSSPDTDNHSMAEEPDRAEMQSIMEELNEIGMSKAPHLAFSIDEASGHAVVQMTLQETGELLRQIPTKEFLVIARMILHTTQSLSDQPGRWIELDA